MTGPPRTPPRRLLAASLLIAAVIGTALIARLVTAPENPILTPDHGAEWIRFDEPFGLSARPIEIDTVHFRASFVATSEQLERTSGAQLELRSLRSHRLTVNGRKVEDSSATATPWRTARRVDLSRLLQPGLNEIRIAVDNDRGPPALLVAAEIPELRSGPAWRASRDQGTWTPAVAVARERQASLSRRFPTPLAALRATWPVLLVLLGLGAAAALFQLRSGRFGAVLTAARFRWLLLAVWTALCLHNFTRIHIEVGFDVRQHYEYIIHILTEGRLPLATEGWQFFQPPLFYLAAAPLFLVFAKLSSMEAAQLAVRALTMACGLGLIELTYRTARTVFPGRESLQRITTTVGGFLPMNLYMSHYASNEPLAAVLTAALVFRAFVLLMDESGNRLGRDAFGLGVLLGLAVLTKVSAALLSPLLLALLVWVSVRDTGSPRAAFVPALRMGIAAAAIAGWYFVRNWMALGRPYVGGWDPSRGHAWWQYPGYRVPEDFLSFGTSLVHPILASFGSVWDGLYSTLWLDGFLGSMVLRHVAPPWSYDHMIALALLSLPMAAIGALGTLRALWRPTGRTEWAVVFAAACIGVYVTAVVVLFASLPVYSTTKSSYTLGLIPCYGVLIAWGFDALPERRWVRVSVWSYLCGWLGFVLLAFTV